METKQCSKCKINKTLEEFNKKSSSRDGLSSYCKECNKINLKRHYNSNEEYYKNKSKNYNLSLRNWLTNYKKNLSCSQCGESRWWVLDFHHRDPEKKEGNINNILFSKGKEKTLEEISKCEVLCANCHRDVHYKLRLVT